MHISKNTPYLIKSKNKCSKQNITSQTSIISNVNLNSETKSVPSTNPSEIQPHDPRLVSKKFQLSKIGLQKSQKTAYTRKRLANVSLRVVLSAV